MMDSFVEANETLRSHPYSLKPSDLYWWVNPIRLQQIIFTEIDICLGLHSIRM